MKRVHASVDIRLWSHPSHHRMAYLYNVLLIVFKQTDRLYRFIQRQVTDRQLLICIVINNGVVGVTLTIH